MNIYYLALIPICLLFSDIDAGARFVEGEFLTKEDLQRIYQIKNLSTHGELSDTDPQNVRSLFFSSIKCKVVSITHQIPVSNSVKMVNMEILINISGDVSNKIMQDSII